MTSRLNPLRQYRALRRDDPARVRPVKVRFALLGFFLLASLLVLPPLGLNAIFRPLLLGISIAFASNLLSLAWILWGRGVQYRKYFATFVDFFLLTFVIHYFGGIETTISWAYALVVITMALLYGRRVALYAAAVSSLMYSSLLIGEYLEIIPHVNFHRLNPIYIHTDPLYLYSKLLSDNLLFFVAAIVAGVLSERIIQSRRDVEEKNRQLQEEIANRERAEATLRDSEKRYAATLDAVPDMIYETTFDGKFLYVNKAASTDLGYSPDDLDEVNMIDILDQEGLRTAYRVGEDLLEGKTPPPAFYNLRTADGRTIPIEARVILQQKEDGTQTILGISRDISERTKAEEALRESEERFRALTENTSDMTVILDKDGVHKYMSPSAERLFGYSQDEIIGNLMAHIVHPDDVPVLAEVFEQLRENAGKTVRLPEVRVQHKDGEWRYVETSFTEMMDVPGVNGVVINCRDITEQKQGEQQRKDLEARLRHAEKMEAIGTLAGGVAHDFNNLLMVIQGNISLMLSGIEPDHPHCERLKSIEDQVRSGAGLTDQLLGFAREGRYEVIPVDLNKIVKETATTFGRTRKEITIRQELSDDLGAIEADRGQIEQVLLNLFVNAADAMPEGGELILKTKNVTDEDMRGKTYYPGRGAYSLLTVTDTGEGMGDEIRERIFEPFFTTKAMGRGTGLGLASAYGIIKGHGGYIDVESEMGLGTTFSIYLPSSGKKVAETRRTPDEVVVSGSGTVLIVDDEPIVLQVGAEMLEALGFDVLLADGGKKAVEIYEAERDKIDLVIIDMVMPDMRGGEVYEAVKQIDPQVKALLSSGYSRDGRAESILNSGCNGFLQKPYTMGGLSAKIEEILGERPPPHTEPSQ